MRIAIWKTGHEIADAVADALKGGCYDKEVSSILYDGIGDADITRGIEAHDVHIGYGILRGTGDIFRRCDSLNKPWFNLDRGYFGPGHYGGYYRISLCGTQQTTGLDKLEPDYESLDRLRIVFPDPYRINSEAHTLIVPPTDYVRSFFDLGRWEEYALDNFPNSKIRVRHKGGVRTLDDDLTNCLRVVTFNSSIGWEALRRGIPVYSDSNHSIIGAYQKLRKTDDRPLHLDLKARRELFAIMSGLQMTLEEIRSGKICTLMEKLLSLFPSSLAGIPGNQLPATLHPTPSSAEPITQ